MRVTVPLLALAMSSGCGPGDGSTLDESGHFLAKPWAPAVGSTYGAANFNPTFSDIQSAFLSRFCTECHSGAGAPKGLDLSGPEAYDRLVGVKSSERPSLARIEPRDPQRSYLLLKLKGTPGISGQRMPRNRPARPESELELITQWIQAGAPRN